MKVGLIFVFLTLLLTGCDSVDTNESAEVTTDPLDDTPFVISPSSNSISTTNTEIGQFENDYASKADHSFWSCTTERHDHIELFLGRGKFSEQFAVVSTNEAEAVEGVWAVTASDLTITLDDSYSPLVFSDYLFTSDTTWASDVSSDSGGDQASCVLYDQDSNLMDSLSDDVSFSSASLVNELDEDGRFTSFWLCESDSDDPFRVIYEDDGRMGISVDGGDFLFFTWIIDAESNTIFWNGISALEFSSVAFQNIDSHSGYFQGDTAYQCARERVSSI